MDDALHILRVSPIEKIFELRSTGNAAPAGIAVARVENQRASRDALRRKCDQLLRVLAQRMGADNAEPITIRRVNGSAPGVYRGEEICSLRTSVAHSGAWVAVGLTNQGNIGVDIQVRDDRKRYREIAEFLDLDSDALRDKQRFFSSWALREAIAKATDESVLTSHALEPQLAAACRTHGRVVNAGCFSAMVDIIAPDAHLAVVLKNAPEAQTCA